MLIKLLFELIPVKTTSTNITEPNILHITPKTLLKIVYIDQAGIVFIVSFNIEKYLPPNNINWV